MKLLVLTLLLSASANAAISYSLPGTSEKEGWQNLTSTNYGPTLGFPVFPSATNPWPSPVAPNVTGSAASALFDKVSGGGYFASASVYDAGVGGIYRISDASPLASLATIILQIDAGTTIGIGPTLSFNGGSQALPANFFNTTSGEFLSGFGGVPEPTTNHLYQWDTTGLGITSYELTWGSNADEHLTQYALALDSGDQFLQVVPEPSSALIIGLLPTLGLLRRRRETNKA